MKLRESDEPGVRSAWTRLRSVGLLALLLTGLGVAAAATVGAVAIAVATLIDQALG